MVGRLTTHVLYIKKGCPGVNITIQLWKLDPTSEARTLLKAVQTNQDGRTDEPLLIGEELAIGVYELVFNLGDYFQKTQNPPFLERVPIRFGIADTNAHYHVPLLASPWAYSTYRGS
jgi:5-hydroxyisourate hydrolase